MKKILGRAANIFVQEKFMKDFNKIYAYTKSLNPTQLNRKMDRPLYTLAYRTFATRITPTKMKQKLHSKQRFRNDGYTGQCIKKSNFKTFFFSP